MKKHIGICVLAWLTATGVMATNDFRVWHDLKNRAVTARMVALTSNSVTLARKDGVSNMLEITQLSVADRAYLDALAADAAQEKALTRGERRKDLFSLRPAYIKFGIDVRDQGRRGSCLIFGTLNPLEFQHALRSKDEKLSERFTTWAANTFRGKGNGNEGYSPAEVIGGIRTYGYTTERIFGGKYRDHGAVGRPDKEALADAEKRKNVDVRFFGGPTGLASDDIQAMCATITASNPVTLCLNWPEKVSFSPGKIIKPWKKKKGGHAIVAVGYVRDKSEPGGGLFEVRNSWGDNWGDDGYAFITFELLAQEFTGAFCIKPAKE